MAAIMEARRVAIERMKMGVLMQMPRASEEEITAEILRRLKIGRLMENQD